MERNTINGFYSWILLIALVCWIVRCGKPDRYSFPVYTTASCPRNQSEWKYKSSILNCTDSNGYMCIPNEDITELLEFCYRYPRIPIEKGICLIMKKSTSNVDDYICNQFRSGCPNRQYWSNEIFKFPACLSIGNGCFLPETFCHQKGTTTLGSAEITNTQDGTKVYLGPITLNTSFQSTVVAVNGDENNTWVWILVLGFHLLISFIPVCVLVIIFRRRGKKVLDVSFDEVETHKSQSKYRPKGNKNNPPENYKLKKREICDKEQEPFIDERKDSDEKQDPDAEGLPSMTKTKILDAKNDLKERRTKRKGNEEELGTENSNKESLPDCLVEEKSNILCLDETRRKSDPSREDNSLPKLIKNKLIEDRERRGSNHRVKDNDRISSEELERAGIQLDGYEMWKTDMSEKYKQLTKEERFVLFLLLCSDENTFDLENSEKVKERFSEKFESVIVSKDICETIHAMQSKGFVCIEGKKLTFASDAVQDETMFDYVHTDWVKSKHSSVYSVLTKVSLESSVKYFRSQGYRKGKCIRCFNISNNSLFNFSTTGYILTRIISEFGKDILLHAIMDDKELHSTISAELKIPEEVLLWDLDARRRYLEYLKKGKTPLFRSRAMIVGCAGAGKTTLLQRLLKKSMDEIRTIKATVGLDVHNDIFEVHEEEGKLKATMHKCEPSIHIKEKVPLKSTEEIEKKKLLSILDFGGQCMYYACHQIYLSKRAFYILVIDMSKNLEDVIDEELCDQKDTMFSEWSHKDYLLFWLKSVDCYCGSRAPVILVATHAEGKSEEEKIKYYKELINTFPGSSTIKMHLSNDRYFMISLPRNDTLNMEKLDELERCIVDIAKSQKGWGEEIPMDWAIFEEFISARKETTKIQRLDTLKKSFDYLLPLSRQEFADLLHFYHDIGLILYFSFHCPISYLNTPHYLDSDIAILDIQWFVNSFKYVVTDSKQASFTKVLDAAPTREELETFTTIGEISGTFLKAIWEKTNNSTAVEYKNDMIKYMERLGLMAIDELSDMCFIPSMNKTKIPHHIKSKIRSHPNKSPTLYIRFPVLPFFLFYRLIVLCLKRDWKPLMDDGRKCIYIDTAMFAFQEHVVVLGVSESYIQLLLYRDDEKQKESMQVAFSHVKEEVLIILSSLTKTLNKGLRYEVGYSCTPTEFGKELGKTFIKQSNLFGYHGKGCLLHALTKDHNTETLNIFLEKECEMWKVDMKIRRMQRAKSVSYRSMDPRGFPDLIW